MSRCEKFVKWHKTARRLEFVDIGALLVILSSVLTKSGSVRKLVIILTFLSLLFASLSVYLNTARIAYYNERDFPRAKKACLDGIRTGHANFELYGILGGCEIGLGNWQSASEALIKAFKLDSLKTLAWINQKGGGEEYFAQAFYFSAREFYDAQRYDEALDNLRYAVLLDPVRVPIYILRGAVYYKMKNVDAANKEYKTALDIDPESADVYFLIGKSLFEIKEYDSSLVYFDNALKYYSLAYNKSKMIVFKNVSETEERVHTIVSLWSTQKTKELDTLLITDLGFDQGVAVHTQTIGQFVKAAADLARCYYYKGMTYYNVHSDSAALANLAACLYFKPDDVDALFFAGELLVRMQNYRDAVQYLDTLTQLKSDDVFAWFYLGVCYTQLKEYRKALDVYENRVLQLDPEYIDAMNNLAYIYDELGDHKKAHDYLLRVDELKKNKQKGD